MRNILLVVLACSGIIISGCGTLPMTSWEDHETREFTIDVRSEPEDAEIYFDNTLVGRTPASSLLIGIPSTTIYYLGGVDDHIAQGTHYLRVSKKGYKDAVEAIEFEREDMVGVTHGYSIKKGKYHFVLEPAPQAIQESSSSEVSKAEEIGKYKELLDKGAITKEEFEQKKKQLLGL